VPGCNSGSGPRRDVDAVRKDCAPAVIGAGRIGVEILLTEQSPLSIETELLVLNGGLKGKVVRLFVFAYLSAPVTRDLVIPVKVERIDKGRYGLEASTTIPKIAGGSGSITFFKISLKRGILSATCPTGRLKFHNAAVFADGTRLKQPVVRTCAPRN
jgi:hypothetical protein